MESKLTAATTSISTASIESPWDVWWICYRAGASVAELSLEGSRFYDRCELCLRDVFTLTVSSPPRHPDSLGMRACACMHIWAVRMRRPAEDVAWPPLRTTIAMAKPGADVAAITRSLLNTYAVIDTSQRTLTKADVRRLYPDAYGAEYVAAQDTYLTSGPVQILVLLANESAAGKSKEIKAALRQQHGTTDQLRNHLHMPDNPGDALCDIAHLAGYHILDDLYGRYDRDSCQLRLHGYRALLAQR